MSVRNAAATLPLALSSLQLQTFTDWELLVADDGSIDASRAQLRAAAAHDPRVRIFEHDAPRGLAQRLNELTGRATASLVARMDADDVCYPARLEQQVAFMDAHPDVDLVGTSLLVFGAGGRAIGRRDAPAEHDAITRRPQAGFHLFHPTWLGRAHWFRAHPYDPAAVRCEDQDLLFRSHSHSRFANLPQPLLGYREEHVRLPGLLTGRLNMSRRWAPQLWGSGRRLAAGQLVAEQVAKGALDTLAVSLSAERVLLRHRARGLSQPDRSGWAEVWRGVCEDLGSRRSR